MHPELFESEPTAELLASGATWAEGPVWIPESRTLRFSDIPGDRILSWSEQEGLTVYAEGVEFTNGRTLGLQGEVVQCSHGRRRVEVDRGGDVTELVSTYRGARFNSPNDVVVASDGAVWFTDPSYGIEKEGEGHPGELEYGGRWVFRFDPATGEATPVVTDLEQPNGLAFSPDESILYVSDTSTDLPSGEPNPSGGHHIRAYDVRDGRRCMHGRTVVTIQDGVPDGFRVDEHGHLWSSAGDGVHVFTPGGREIGVVPTPRKVGNLCFGGDDGTTLFALASDSLYAVRTRVRDAAQVLRSRG